MDERKIFDISIKIVKDIKTLIESEDAWEGLKNNANIYPFNTFEWIINWWKYFGNGKKMFILLFKNDCKIIGIAPLMITFGEMGFPIKRIKFIGSNNSDYLDFIVRDGYEDIFYKTLIRYLEEVINPYTVLDLEHIPENSGIYSYIKEGHFYYDYDIQDICPYIKLPPTWDEYLSILDGKFRRNLNYETRRFFKEYDGSFSYVKNPDIIENSMEELIKLHQERWRNRHLPGVFYSKRIRDFHKDVAKSMLKKDCLSLFELKNGEKIVASILSYHMDRRRYYYISGYDLEYSKRSVGTVALGLAVKYSIEVGDKVFDFLRGDEEYKKSWTDLKKKNIRFVAAFPSKIGRLYINYIIAENKLINKIKDKFSK
ncbi:MAG: GNAT family N-acetyltransferase [Thermoanaerobacteraceae bacterium]|nr:GNAT family N-acetyltransferase [Thermoanaerobacteraceae bacterium]